MEPWGTPSMISDVDFTLYVSGMILANVMSVLTD